MRVGATYSDRTATSGRLWRSYFRPKPWETDGSIYERLGVRTLKELYFGGRYMNAVVSALRGRRYRPFRGRNWPLRWLRFTMVVEVGHGSIGLYMLAAAAMDVARGDLQSAIGSIALNIVVNVYPVMVQRYNRARLVRIFDVPWFTGSTPPRP